MSDERELRQLYQAMRSEDARHAPPFARVLARPTAAKLGWLRPMALVAMLLVAGLVAAGTLLRRDVPPRVAQTPAKTDVGTGAPVRPAAEPPAATQSTVLPVAARTHKHRPPTIDEWKSPTDAWLQTPDESFRNSLPSLKYSSVNLSD